MNDDEKLRQSIRTLVKIIGSDPLTNNRWSHGSIMAAACLREMCSDISVTLPPMAKILLDAIPSG